MKQRIWSFSILGLCAAALALSFAAGTDPVLAQSSGVPLGGPWGVVRSAKGPIEGMGVQLIAEATAIRTTVYTNEEGRYEFPQMAPGTYTLRVTRPLEFQPYAQEGLQLSGTVQFADITLDRVSQTEYLPPTPDILAQLSGLEWVMNLPGTGKEKRIFTLSCGFGCHSYQQIFRNRYDERSWRLIVQRMLRGAGSPLINMNRMTAERRGRAGIPSLEEEESTIQWLARVRGPESEIPPLTVLPREQGPATRVVITEYELPRTLLAPHDVHGDAQGKIWYSPHRSPYLGALDPATGKVQEFRPPDIEGVLPGTHRIWVDERGYVWASENWAHNLMRLDPRNGEFKRFHFEGAGNLNSPGFSNFAMDKDGWVYETLDDSVVRIDRETGKIVKKWPIPKVRSSYDNIVSFDGRWWAGGVTGTNLIGLVDLQTDEVWELETPTVVSAPARGGFDRNGHAWFGGRGGAVLELDPKTRHITEHNPPFPYEAFYEVLPDKNGDIWAWALHGGRLLRFTPSTNRWIAYMLPEPYSHNRRTWVDNSTTPVTVWYVDHNGYMVRIQPLE